MDETELENMVVRITGDSNDYEGMLEDIAEMTEDKTEEIEDDIEEVEDKWKDMIKNVVGGAIGLITGIGAKNQLKDFLGAFSEAEDVDITLGASLRANKRDVDALMKSYQEYATEIEHQTTMSDESVKMLLKSAEAFGLTGEAAQRATKNAIALGEAGGVGAAAAMRITAALEKGDIARAKAFSRPIKELRGIKDNTEFVTRATELMNAGWETTTEKAGTVHGILKQVDEILGDLKEELGKVVSDFLKPFVAGLKDAATHLQNIPQWVKQATVVMLGLSVAIGVVTAAIMAATAAALLFDISTGGILIILGLIVTTMAVTTAGILTFTTAAGGIGKVVTDAKDALYEFWNWISPTRKAIISLGEAVQEAFGKVVDSLNDAIKDLKLGMDLTDVFHKIQDGAVRTLLTIEFYIRNIERVWHIMWATVGAGLYSLDEDIKFFFSSTIPTLLKFFGENWFAIFMDIEVFWYTVTKNMIDNFVKIMSNLPSLIRGNVSFDELWIPLTEGFKSSIGELPTIAKRNMSQTELMMHKMIAEMWENLDEDRKKFIEEKLKEFGLPPVAEEAAKDTGIKAGEKFNEGLGKEIKKVDAALFASAEALGRIAEHRERTARKATDVAPEKGSFGPRMFTEIKRQQDHSKAMENAVRNGFPPVVIKTLSAIGKDMKTVADNITGSVMGLSPSSLSD